MSSPFQGYFRSQNCRRELYTALRLRKPIVVIRETNAERGGLSVHEFTEECRLACVDEAPDSYPDYQGPHEAISAVFAEETIPWIRVAGFQMESLKLVALRTLRHLPYYTAHPHELSKGLRVPGEIALVALKAPYTLLVSSFNEGADGPAAEIKTAAEEAGGAGSIIIDDAESALPDNTTRPSRRTAMLLYLTTTTFLDSRGELARIIRRAINLNVTIVMLHEQDPTRGGVSFREIIAQTPRELRLPPFQLYDTLAIPLYPMKEHRRISIRHTIRAIAAATPVARQIMVARTDSANIVLGRGSSIFELPKPEKAASIIHGRNTAMDESSESRRI